MEKDEKLIREWIDALRSGEYKQGRMRLCNANSNTYCCLGVLCEVAGLEKVEYKEDVGMTAVYRTKSGEIATELNQPLAERVGLMDEPKNPEYLGDSIMDVCIGLNDSSRLGFDQIADFLEAELLVPDATD